jgi:hypothetical protein
LSPPCQLSFTKGVLMTFDAMFFAAALISLRVGLLS